jgi:predicted enzyme related to lactoylglutathione lyase
MCANTNNCLGLADDPRVVAAAKEVAGCEYPGPVSDSPPTMSVRSLVLDCPDPCALASFYSELLSARAQVDDPDWCEVHLEGENFKLAFQKVSDYRPPDWPDGLPQQAHLDLTVFDLEDASRRAVSLGATVLTSTVQEPGSAFIVHADPAGHPFCLCMDRAGI